MGKYVQRRPETFMWQKTAKNAKKRLFGDLQKYFCYCTHCTCVRELIFLPHLEIYETKLRSKGQHQSLLQTTSRACQRQGTKKITKTAGKNPFFDVEQNPLDTRCTIRLSKFPPILAIIASSQRAQEPKNLFFRHIKNVDLQK